MYREPPTYHTLILHFWLERGTQPQWRFVIEDPDTDTRCRAESVEIMLSQLTQLINELSS